MKTKKIILLAGCLLFSSQFLWATDIDFYEDGVIEEGDNYDFANSYTTSTVDMFGGSVYWFETYNLSMLNIYNGNVQTIISNDQSTVNIFDGLLSTIDAVDNSIVYLHGGTINRHIAIFDDSVAHFYGYGFEFSGPGTRILTGYWADGTYFNIFLRDLPEPFPGSNVILHEIPEPNCMLLCFIGGLILIKKRKR